MGREQDNREGKEWEQIFQNINLNILNTGHPTHIAGTAIDLTVVSPDIAANCSWEVYPTVLSSDHYPIILSCEVPVTRPPVQQNTYNFKKADWKSYARDGKWNMLAGNPVGTCKEMMEHLYNTLYGVADAHVLTFQSRRYYPKPWWNVECTRVWKEIERLYKRWKTTGRIEDKLGWKKARAIATRTFKISKQEEMRNYLSTMTVNTPTSKVYEKLRRMRGRIPRRITILKQNGNIISEVGDIVNCLGENFAKISDSSGCTSSFQRIKTVAKRKAIDFTSNNAEPYNDSFTIEELVGALTTAKDTTPGPDKVHYKMLKNMPQQAKHHLLQMYNELWNNSHYPEQWKDAIVIPIAKPNKDHSDPINYRPIALTSCVCKIFEKMVNGRLVQYLENNKLLTNIQCGFRANRSTLDHLIRLDTFIKQSMADGKLRVAYSSTLRKRMISPCWD